MYRLVQLATLFNAKAATGWSTEMDVSDYRHIIAVVSTSDSANLTLKVAGSILDKDSVAFTSAAAVGNEWDYLFAYNYNTATGFTGDTGLVYTGTDAVEQLEINTNGLKTLAFQVSALAAGKVTVKVFGVTNQ